MLVVQGARMAWANPYVRQAAATIVIEQVIPVAVNVVNEKVVPVAKNTVKEKVIPTVKAASKKTRTGVSNLKKHATNRDFSKASEVFVVTELKNEKSTG